MSITISLEALEIASPCKADWSRMSGDERARFCKSCEKHVYNLADMTRAEAESLIRSREGEVCVRMMRRADGTVITGDCPIGMKIARRSLTWTRSAAALVCLPLVVLAMSAISAHATTFRADSSPPIDQTPPVLMGEIDIQTPAPAAPNENQDSDDGGQHYEPTIMGRIVCPAPPLEPAPGPAPEPSPEPEPTPQD